MKHLCWYYNKIIYEKSVNNIVKACLKSPLVDGKIGLNKTINKKTRSAKIHFIDKNKHALLYKTIYDTGKTLLIWYARRILGYFQPMARLSPLARFRESNYHIGIVGRIWR